jgi:hypothetical protein
MRLTPNCRLEVISASICMSPCSSDHTITRLFNGAFVVVVGVGDEESPNLLIVRTSQIVTAHVVTIRKGCDTNEYCQILGCSSIRRRFYLIRFPVIRPTFVKATAPVKLPT